MGCIDNLETQVSTKKKKRVTYSIRHVGNILTVNYSITVDVFVTGNYP